MTLFEYSDNILWMVAKNVGKDNFFLDLFSCLVLPFNNVRPIFMNEKLLAALSYQYFKSGNHVCSK